MPSETDRPKLHNQTVGKTLEPHLSNGSVDRREQVLRQGPESTHTAPSAERDKLGYRDWIVAIELGLLRQIGETATDWLGIGDVTTAERLHSSQDLEERALASTVRTDHRRETSSVECARDILQSDLSAIGDPSIGNRDSDTIASGDELRTKSRIEPSPQGCWKGRKASPKGDCINLTQEPFCFQVGTLNARGEPYHSRLCRKRAPYPLAPRTNVLGNYQIMADCIRLDALLTKWWFGPVCMLRFENTFCSDRNLGDWGERDVLGQGSSFWFVAECRS